MEVIGRLTKVLELQQGTSKASGKEWQKQSFIIETTEQYNNVYCFEIFGAEKIETFSQQAKIGDNIKVDFNVNTNEWNGKYFTSLSMWKIEVLNNSDAPQTSTQAPPTDTPPPTGGEPSDLPFN